MEDGLQMLKGIPQEFMKSTEKAREKERREKAREDNMTALAAALEERRRKALARSKVRLLELFSINLWRMIIPVWNPLMSPLHLFLAGSYPEKDRKASYAAVVSATEEEERRRR